MPTLSVASVRARTAGSSDAVLVALLLVVVARIAFAALWRQPAVEAWTTVFIAICAQATPYLVLGVVVSTAIEVLVPPGALTKLLPSKAALAVPVAGLVAIALPGCECGSVPVAAGLMRRGVRDAPAVAFLLAAPAVNPVVLVATASAFPGRPGMVLARFVASLLTAVVVGWLWLRVGRAPRLRRHEHAEGSGRWARARDIMGRGIAQSLGLLVIGASCAATIQIALPQRWLDTLGGSGLVAVATMAVLAVIIAVCSEADAFVAASFVRFSPTAQLVFMVVGPMVDVKLIAMQIGTFGSSVAARLAPLSLGVAVAVSMLVGRWLL